MLELIEQLRQLCRDNEDGCIPALVLEHVLTSHEAKLEYQHAVRRIADGEILRNPTKGPLAEFQWTRALVRDDPGVYEMVRRVAVPEAYGQWNTFL